MNAYDKIREWEETRCRKRMPRRVHGRPIVFLCLRPKGHAGPCMEGIAELNDDKPTHT